MLDQDNNFFLTSLRILISCLLNNEKVVKRRSYMLITSGIERVNSHIAISTKEYKGLLENCMSKLMESLGRGNLAIDWHPSQR